MGDNIMVRLFVNCIRCGRRFSSKAYRNKVTREVIATDNICQRCLNRLRQQAQQQSPNVRLIPEKFNKLILHRELSEAEKKRRLEDGKNKN